MKSRVQFFYALLAFLAAEAIQFTIVFGFQMFYGVLIVLKTGLKKASQSVTDPQVVVNEIEKSMSTDILYMISAFAVLACGLVFFFWYRHEIRGEARSSTQETFQTKNLLLIILLAIGCQFFITGIMSLIQQYIPEIFSDYQQQMERLTGGNMVIVLLLMIFVAPIAEELVFRGVILHKASRAIPFWGANLLQAMLFGLYHMNIVQGIYAALMGFLLGLVCHKFRSIYASMFLHMAINTSSLPVALFPQNSVSYIIMTIFGSIFLAVSLILLDITKQVVVENEVSDFAALNYIANDSNNVINYNISNDDDKINNYQNYNNTNDTDET